MMFFTKADKEDFEQVQKLYWNLIDKSQDEESFPGWKKGVYPSDDMIRQNIECGYLYVLKDDDIIKACAICNPYANEEYKQVPWKVNDGPVWIIHTLAVDYDSRGYGVGSELVRNIIRLAGENDIKALHLDVISHNKAAEALYRKLRFTYVSTQTIFYGVVGNKEFKMFEYTNIK